MAGDAWNKILHPSCILSIRIHTLADQLEVDLITVDLQSCCLDQNIPSGPVSGVLRCNADQTKTATSTPRDERCIKCRT